LRDDTVSANLRIGLGGHRSQAQVWAIRHSHENSTWFKIRNLMAGREELFERERHNRGWMAFLHVSVS